MSAITNAIAKIMAYIPAAIAQLCCFLSNSSAEPVNFSHAYLLPFAPNMKQIIKAATCPT